MEEWEFDFEWLKVRHFVKDSMEQEGLPTLQIILFLIGIQELGIWKDDFTKEEKQDLMHIGVCALLKDEGYYKYEGRDDDGWPHFSEALNIASDLKDITLEEQETMLQFAAIKYFRRKEEFVNYPVDHDDFVGIIEKKK